MKTTSIGDRPGHMFGTLRDTPNVMTLTGFALSMLAIFMAAQGRYDWAMVAALWAVAVDWLDGWLARRLLRRPAAQGEMGAQLDSFADLMSSGIFPAVLVASVGQFDVLYVSAALFIALAGVVRLSFFNVYGATPDGRVLGLPIAHNILVLALVVVFRDWLEPETFVWVLATTNVALAAMNLGTFYFPRGGASAIPWIIGYVVAMTVLLVPQAIPV